MGQLTPMPRFAPVIRYDTISHKDGYNQERVLRVVNVLGSWVLFISPCSFFTNVNMQNADTSRYIPMSHALQVTDPIVSNCKDLIPGVRALHI